jgi:apolipoprotein N-acyltransferase
MIAFLMNAALGAASIFAFAPYGHAWLIFITLAWFFARVLRANTARQAAWTGLAFGLGFFGFGLHWMFTALTVHGGMVVPLAVLANSLMALYCALYGTLAAYLAHRWQNPTKPLASFALLAVLFVLVEMLRGYAFTGFAWLPLAASQVDGSPLASYAPIAGATAVSLAVALCAACLAWAWPAVFPRPLRLVMASVLIGLIAITGAELKQRAWTQPGSEISVSLVQPSVLQADKFRADKLPIHLLQIEALLNAAKGKLIVFPETTLTAPLSQIPADNLNRWQAIAKAKDAQLIIGIIGQDAKGYSNAAMLLSDSALPTYRKQHLVPFGEYMPLRPLLGWFYDNVAIPLSDMQAGADTQPPFRLKGLDVALSICYEDVFSAPLRNQLAQSQNPSLMLNLTNDAWYEKTPAAAHHLQLSQLRAAEFARPMLRSTNTGMTAQIDAQGRVVQSLPWFEPGVLEMRVKAVSGATPFQTHGDAIILGVLLSLLGLLWLRVKQA